MLEGINALIDCFSLMWQAFFNAPLFNGVTFGYFLISCAVIGILVSFFVGRLK